MRHEDGTSSVGANVKSIRKMVRCLVLMLHHRQKEERDASFTITLTTVGKLNMFHTLW